MQKEYIDIISPLVPLTTPILNTLGIKDFDKNQIREWRKQFSHGDFPELKNKAYLQAMNGEQQSHVPVWVMRQAGRYLSCFREVRKNFSFFEICENPILACEVTLQPLHLMDYDASIIFSDILVIPQALGCEVQMVEGKGPVFPKPLEVSGLESLVEENRKDPPNERESVLEFVYDAICLTRMAIGGKVPLMAFCGTPWTLMTYMVEGGGSKLFSKAKKWLYAHPHQSHALLLLLADTCFSFLSNCIAAGAQSVQLFDSNCHVLEKNKYLEFSLYYVTYITRRLKQKHPQTPITYFQKDQKNSAQEIFSEESFDTISIDSTVDTEECVRLAKQHKKTIQGNMDTAALYGSDDSIRQEVARQIDTFGRQGYIANLGQGIWPDVDPAKVEVFIKAFR